MSTCCMYAGQSILVSSEAVSIDPQVFKYTYKESSISPKDSTQLHPERGGKQCAKNIVGRIAMFGLNRQCGLWGLSVVPRLGWIGFDETFATAGQWSSWGISSVETSWQQPISTILFVDLVAVYGCVDVPSCFPTVAETCQQQTNSRRKSWIGKLFQPSYQWLLSLLLHIDMQKMTMIKI